MRDHDRPPYDEPDVQRLERFLPGHVEPHAALQVVGDAVVTTQDQGGDEAQELFRPLVEGARRVGLAVQGQKAPDPEVPGGEQALVHLRAECTERLQGGRIPVFVDGGIRRGTDIFKALALGAKAVGIGRPYIWGLGSFGQQGVERVLDILTRELRIVMTQMGAAKIADISKTSLQPF